MFINQLFTADRGFLATDLKSWAPQGACGFDPRPRHFRINALCGLIGKAERRISILLCPNFVQTALKSHYFGLADTLQVGLMKYRQFGHSFGEV